jgi:alkanesulfonate monooxygenase SsuD/methylene tetrahydromethanopterin reductase-like flavin-dependent oxidoreductase (luciferase family)
MDIGIGLPATIPGVTRDQVLGWARRAEERGFASLGVIDRIVYPNLEPLIALTAAAAVTERIRLTSSILIVPYRNNDALLAKQAASLDVISGGRLTLGVAVGMREDDYKVSGVPIDERGPRMDAALAELRRIWAGEDGTGPTPVQDGGPPLIGGGTVAPAYRRAARFGAGWVAGGGGPDAFAQGAEQARAAWRDAGRDGEPRLLALAYYSLGDDAREDADRYLKHYYAWLGEVADYIAAGALIDPDAVRDAVQQYSDHGCDELILFPCSPDPAQVDLLADAVL